ncbi:MAG: hypothetical protein LBH37_01575 [Oscillospiraceae bacterium]|jgi:hypothetical protein|nr:hypothetical protein [Oscillospiraceae bacterium]
MNSDKKERNSNFNAGKLDMESVGNDVSGGFSYQELHNRTAAGTRIYDQPQYLSPHYSTGYDNYRPPEEWNRGGYYNRNSAPNNWGYNQQQYIPHSQLHDISPRGRRYF